MSKWARAPEDGEDKKPVGPLVQRYCGRQNEISYFATAIFEIDFPYAISAHNPVKMNKAASLENEKQQVASVDNPRLDRGRMFVSSSLRNSRLVFGGSISG